MTSAGASPARQGSSRLEQVWDTRPGLLGWLGAVNHKQIGRRYIATALTFFVIGGIEAVLLRIQLGAAESTFLSPELYNQLFTMHGTTMMFLFAVPITEAVAIYLAPLMLGARDMPLPRLNAFGYWAYLFGGLFLHASLFVGEIPDGGWFAYPPLTGPQARPGLNLDFWLLGVTFIEIAGVVAAVELVILVFRNRAPGIALSRIPLFVWSALVTAIMVLFAFPPLIVGSLMLELDRKLLTVFYDAAAGGDPMLWQHLFWWFGHPEVYIILLPAIGLVSMIVPTFAGTRMVGYPLVAASTVAIGIVSFGLWAHHMYATGLPTAALSFFAAGSLAIAIPSGVQVFAWIATMWAGRIRWAVPMYWVVGFIVTFTLGGITGVMVALVPFDWQVHDTYFVVAHFHYVLIGGVVFPLFAGFFYWLPKVVGRMPSERWGKAGFWLTFFGFHATFFVQHILGLLGMPRRVYTFPSGIGWDVYNLISTVGALVLAAGFALALGTLVIGARRGPPAGDNPWGSGSLEWATASPPPPHNFDRLPFVNSTDPLWDAAASDQPWPDAEEFAEAFADPRATCRRIAVTTVLDAEPEHLTTLPAHSLWPLGLAAAMSLLLFAALVDLVELGLLSLIAIAGCLLGWGWSRQDELSGPAREGPPLSRGGAHRPISWTGTAVALVAIGMGLATPLFAYAFLGLEGGGWLNEGSEPLPLGLPAVGAAVLAASLASAVQLQRAARAGSPLGMQAGAAGVALLGGAFLAVQAASYARLGLAPSEWALHSVFALSVALHHVVAVGGVGAAALMILQIWDRPGPRIRGAAVSLALYWFVVAGAWALVAAVLYLSPFVWRAGP